MQLNKAQLRKSFLQQREQRYCPETEAMVSQNVARYLHQNPPNILAAYAPYGREVDIWPTLRALDPIKTTLLLPKINAADKSMSFGLWTPGGRLVANYYGILEPEEASPLRPEVLLIPFLAVDPALHRLGYGGGFYDRTLQTLRAEGPVQAMGIGYAWQQVEALPTDPWDQPLDHIFTDVAS